MEENRRRLSSISILVLIGMIIPILIINEIIKRSFIDYLLDRLDPEDPVKMVTDLQNLFTVFPWVAYFTLVGSFASLTQIRRGAGDVSVNVGAGNQETPGK